MSQQQGLGPRRAALYMLDQVTGEGKLLPELIGEGALQHLSPEDRARAQRLTTDALRGLDRADRMLKPYLKKAPPEMLRLSPETVNKKPGMGSEHPGMCCFWKLNASADYPGCRRKIHSWL